MTPEQRADKVFGMIRPEADMGRWLRDMIAKEIEAAEKAAKAKEAEDIVACIMSTTWGGWMEIVEMIQRRHRSRQEKTTTKDRAE